MRNAILIAALAVNGRWQYRERGLLDVTHLRFFTLEEILRMFAETGYRYEYHMVNLAAPLAELYQNNVHSEKITLQLGRLTIADVTPAELSELCAEQFFVRARLRLTLRSAAVAHRAPQGEQRHESERRVVTPARRRASSPIAAPRSPRASPS